MSHNSYLHDELQHCSTFVPLTSVLPDSIKFSILCGKLLSKGE